MLATIVVALHFFAPRPPGRAPLPTARFLREDTHTTLRFRRRPTDAPVMALRALLALLLGLMFAQPQWLPQRADGVTRVVLLDRGAGMASVWDAAMTRALQEADVANVRFVTFADGLPSLVDPAALAQVVPADRESSYLGGLRALRMAAEEVPSRELEAVLITRGRWSAWDPQLAGLREAAWPGALEVVWIEGPDSPEDGVGGQAPGPSIPSRQVPGPLHPALVPALRALGYEVAAGEGASGPSSDASPRAAGSASTAPPQGVLRFVSLTDANEGDVAAVRRGDTVVVYGDGPAEAGPVEVVDAWAPDGWGTGRSDARGAASNASTPGDGLSAGHGVVRVGDERISFDDARFLAGRAVARTEAAALLPIVLDDGTPVAVAEAIGSGCLVRFGGPIEVGVGHPAYPHLIRALADGCHPRPRAGVSTATLDSAARAALEGAGEPRVLVSALDLGTGTPLSGWVLLLAVLVAVIETMWVHRGVGALGEARSPRTAA